MPRFFEAKAAGSFFTVRMKRSFHAVLVGVVISGLMALARRGGVPGRSIVAGYDGPCEEVAIDAGRTRGCRIAAWVPAHRL